MAGFAMFDPDWKIGLAFQLAHGSGGPPAREESRPMSGPQPAPAETSTAAEPDPLLGRILNDRYRIVEAIGHGGMGRVYKAVQSPLDRVVALKILGAGHDRDPNPANVMLLRQQDDHDFVKVLDFGLVKFFSGEGPENDITNAGTFMGSPHYIAPEQARHQGPDQRCDIYSLGVLLYHMLAGRVPFTAPAPVDVILKHLHDAPVPPRQLRPDLQIAPELQRIVLRCMAKGREQRYQSMDELLVHLKAVRAHLTGMSAPHPVPPQPGPQPQAKPVIPGMITQTPPTPQPGLRTPSEPMSALRSTPARGTPHPTRPPPPPPEAMLDDEPAPLGPADARSPLLRNLAALSRLPVVGRLVPSILARVEHALARLSSEAARIRSGFARIAS